jgi:hypothetical protein
MARHEYYRGQVLTSYTPGDSQNRGPTNCYPIYVQTFHIASICSRIEATNNDTVFQAQQLNKIQILLR